MNKAQAIYNSIGAYISAIALLLSSIGCTGSQWEDKPQPGGDEPDIQQMWMHFSVQSELSQSRGGTWAEPYESENPLDFENEVKSIDVLLYDRDDKFLSRLPGTIHRVQGRPDPYDFTVSVNCSSDWLTPDTDGSLYLAGRLIIIANCGTTSGDGLGSIVFRQPPTSPALPLDKKTLIPMWGSRLIRKIPIKPNTSHFLGNLHLLRAMAKITVELAPETATYYKLHSATLNSYPEFGNAVPSGALEADSTLSLGVEECFNPMTDPLKASGYPLTPITYTTKDSDGREKTVTQLIGYVPETINPGRNLYLSVVIADRNGNPIDIPDRRIFFTEYTDGRPSENDADNYNLVRNHSYKFTIRNVTDIIELSYTVCDWDDYTTDIIFD